MIPHLVPPLGRLAVLLGAVLAAGCALAPTGDSTARREEPRVEAVSESPPVLGPRLDGGRGVPNRPAAAGSGDCAPRYGTGQLGTCIDQRPCRGLGVVDERGAVVCACYATEGGCASGQRCDAKKKTCVPDDEPLKGRPAVR